MVVGSSCCGDWGVFALVMDLKKKLCLPHPLNWPTVPPPPNVSRVRTKRGSLSVEGLLSMGPTPSSFFKNKFFLGFGFSIF